MKVGNVRSVLQLSFVLSMCVWFSATPTVAQGIHQDDEFERFNRGVHNFNKGFDRHFFKPMSQAYGAVVPTPLDMLISNFSGNLDLPIRTANYVFQADPEGAAVSVGRFGVNTTFGILGLFDVASAMGIPDDDTDFGATLHVWGAGEGNYLELPFLGPSNMRDATGIIVDAVLDPVSYLAPGRYDKYLFTVAAFDRLGDRHDNAGLIDSLLYESQDSYVAVQQVYLQVRRRDLNEGILDEDLEDPYAFEDPYAE